MADGLRKMLREGVCDIKNEELNKVICDKEEIRMLNIRNRKKKEELKDDVGWEKGKDEDENSKQKKNSDKKGYVTGCVLKVNGNLS